MTQLRIGDRAITRVGCGDVRLATAAARGLDAREVERALHAALELGLALLDAADEDAAERLCGDAVRALRLRDRVVLACRVPALPARPGAARRDVLPERLPVAYVQERIEASLRATRLDALPLAQLPLRGAWRASSAWPELAGACARLVREGKVLAWGALCGDRPGPDADATDADLLRESWLAALSIPYSLCERGAEPLLAASLAAAEAAAARAAEAAARVTELGAGAAGPAEVARASDASPSSPPGTSGPGDPGASSGPGAPDRSSGPAAGGSSLVLAAPDILSVLSAAGAADPIAAAAVLQALDAPPPPAPPDAPSAADAGAPAGRAAPSALAVADAVHRREAPAEPKLILARRPLGGGALAGALGPGARLGLRDDRALDAAALERLAVLAARLAPLVEREPLAARSCEAAIAALERGRRPDHVEARTLAELALRFVLTRGAVALPRLHRADHVPEALAAAAAPPLSRALLDRLDDLLPPPARSSG